MNKLLFLLLYIISNTIFAQKNINVMYKTNIVNSESQASLLITKTNSFYEEGIDFKKKDTDDLGEGRFTIGSWIHQQIFQDINTLGTIKIKLFQNKDQFSFVQKDYYIIDKLHDMNWTINHDKTKINILGYACQEATVEFRGSKFIAYFTNEIPTTFGPWKFHGLPGLILSIKSQNNPSIYWEAEEIKFPYSKEIPEETSSITFDTTMQEYINEYDSLIETRGKNYAAKAGIIYQPIPSDMKRSNSRERKYEWETW